MLFIKKTKPESHTSRILKQLKKAGKYGCYNHELAKPGIGGIGWHRRITDLRKSGEKIIMLRLSNGKVKYFYADKMDN